MGISTKKLYAALEECKDIRFASPLEALEKKLKEEGHIIVHSVDLDGSKALYLQLSLGRLFIDNYIPDRGAIEELLVRRSAQEYDSRVKEIDVCFICVHGNLIDNWSIRAVTSSPSKINTAMDYALEARKLYEEAKERMAETAVGFILHTRTQEQ